MSGRAAPLEPAPARLSQGEFIALMAMLFSTIAFSIDAMLPALPDMAAELAPDTPNRVQLIITSFILGMGLGTLVTGPLSDAYGRKPIILIGAALYILGSALAWMAQSLELLLAARIVQGLGAAGPRVVALAIIRDLYEGRTMARIMSFVILVFSLVPAIAPTVGAGIIWLTDWHGIFASFIIFAVIGSSWYALRQPETLPPERRRPFRVKVLWSGIREILSNALVVHTIAAQSLCFAILFATLSSVQQVFDITFGQGAHFHLWFGLIAVLAASASVLNARIVERVGMRRIVTWMLVVQIVLSSVTALIFMADLLPGHSGFVVYFLWTVGVFFQAGMTLGNLNALAMSPMGHLAGLTASVSGSIATVISVCLAAPLGLMFDGTPRPLVLGTLALAVVALMIMRRVKDIAPTS